MALAKLKFGLTVLLIGGAGVFLLSQSQVTENLRLENASLREELAQLQVENESLSTRLARLIGAQVLTRPSVPAQASAPAPDFCRPTNLLARFPGLTNRLSARQLEAYLLANGRNAASLLGSYHTTGDPALLSEAMQKFPNYPQVALDAVLRKDASSEDRRQWLEALKQSDPNNSLPNYLSALQDLQAGQTNRAIQELFASSGKSQFQDYSADALQEDEQAYLAAGYSMTEAKAVGLLREAMLASGSWEEADAFASQQSLALFPQIKALAVSLRELADSYLQAGDQASAQTVLHLGDGLGQRCNNLSTDGFRQLVGTAAEVIELSAMDPNSPYADNGQTVQDRINQLRDQRKAVRGLYQEAVPLLATLSDEDWCGYAGRVQSFGELAALQWVAGKLGQK